MILYEPTSSVTTGPFRMQLELEGETVLSAKPEVGFLHRGIEKIAERMPWTGFLPYTDRVDYVSAIHSNLAYALAVEKLSKTEVPERASFIRVFVSELSRIGSHLWNFSLIAKAVGFETAHFYTLRDRERINDLFEMLSGARLTYCYLRIGGVALDVTAGFIERTYEFMDYMNPKIAEYRDLFTNNKVFKGRLCKVGCLPPSKALELGISGPNLRASGVAFDCRRIFPYSCFHKFDFNIPVGSEVEGVLGDSFNRFEVRLKEIEESVSIIKQALDMIPEGPIRSEVPRLFKPPRGESYAVVESPRGLFGVYVLSNGEKYPERVRFRTPSFSMLGAFSSVFNGLSLSDVPLVLGSLDLSTSEVDR